MESHRNHRRILIYDPNVDGHHIGYLRFISESLLDAGYQVSLAVDTRPESFPRIQEQMADLLGRMPVISAWGDSTHGRRDKVKCVADCLVKAGADAVFLTTFDEIASPLLRQSAFGLMPPEVLRGKLGGIYMRPRFLIGPGISPNLWIKSLGFMRLLRAGWFRQLLFLDPFMDAKLRVRHPQAPSFFLPDPYPDNFTMDRAEAMHKLGVPPARPVFLFYGGAYRRKGLHLAVKAMLNLPENSPAFLLCAGKQPKDSGIARDLEKLAAQGRALFLNRYVSNEEEKMVFAACDFVLLPYINHFGSSGVLARAAGAGKPVIASDEQLVGRLTHKYNLGPLFPSGNVPALQQAILQAVAASPPELDRWQAGAQAFAQQCSHAAFQTALIAAIDAGFAHADSR
jgi:glycosyltransferase involved in cell wall biosynthesis